MWRYAICNQLANQLAITIITRGNLASHTNDIKLSFGRFLIAWLQLDISSCSYQSYINDSTLLGSTLFLQPQAVFV